MHPLDNPAWHALTTLQAAVGFGDTQARRYTPDISPIAALADPASAACWDALAELVEADQAVGIFAAPSNPPEDMFKVEWRDAFAQMMCTKHTFRGEPARAPAGLSIRELTLADGAAMVDLARLTEPGPMEKRTVSLGRYLGIFDERDGLVAMAGERVRLDGFVEVSGVCTHPEHRGKRYAQHLVADVTARIVERGDAAFLHVREQNVGAVNVYDKLGFSIRARFDIAVFAHKSAAPARH